MDLFLLIIFLLLTSCILYLIYAYTKLLGEYSELKIKVYKNGVKESSIIAAEKFVNQKVESAIGKATEEAVNLISENAKNVSLSIKRKSVEKLIEEKKGEDEAISREFDSAKAEIEKFRDQEFERVRKNANEILVKIMPEVLKNMSDKTNAENIVINELENAKRSNIF